MFKLGLQEIFYRRMEALIIKIWAWRFLKVRME